MLELYKNIKNERIKNGWNQTELAKKVGYSDKSMIAKIEAGKVDLPQTKIRAFAKVFGCSESYLMGWDEDEKLSKHSELLERLYDAKENNEKIAFVDDEEIELLKSFRLLNEESKRQIVLMLAFLKDQENKK